MEFTNQEFLDSGIIEETGSESEDNHELNKSTSDEESHISMKEMIKYESDEDTYLIPMLDNTTQELSQESNDTENDTKCDNPELLDKVGDGNASSVSNVGTNPKSPDEDRGFLIPKQSVESRKRVKLNENTQSTRTLRKRRPIRSTRRGGNTGPAAAVRNKGRTFSCPHCNYSTPNKSYLKRHSKKHSTRN